PGAAGRADRDRASPARAALAASGRVVGDAASGVGRHPLADRARPSSDRRDRRANHRPTRRTPRARPGVVITAGAGRLGSRDLLPTLGAAVGPERGPDITKGPEQTRGDERR